MKRVVITGAGTVNPLGADVPATLAAMAEGRVAIGPVDLPGADRLSARLAASVRDFRPDDHLSPALIAQADRFAQFALVAARQALAAAALPEDEDLRSRTGVIVGSAGGGLGTVDAAFRAVYAEGRGRVAPLTVPRLMLNGAASLVSIDAGLRGPVFALASACASSNHAIGLAFQLVRSGVAPAMLAGGADAMLTFGGLKAWEGLKIMATDACRPFSLGRTGLVQGEGAAVFVLEDRDFAMARGVPILAEIAGFGMCADAGHIVQPDQAGAERAIRLALADAGLAPAEVGYVNAHGTGTLLNDLAEARAIAAVFGPDAGPLVSSTKSLHGHLMGGTGAVELLAAILALRDGVIAPTAGLTVQDPACAIRLVAGSAARAPVGAALSNAFAFGGLNAVLALRAANDSAAP